MLSIGIGGVRERVANGYYNHKLEYPKKDSEIMKEGYITDENKSVKWNREQVELNKKSYYSKLQEYRSEACKLMESFKNDLLGILMVQYKCTEKASEFLINKAWEKGRSDGLFAVIDELEDLIGLIGDFCKYNNQES